MLVTDFVIRWLRDHERVTHFFGYPGGTNAPILDSIHRTEGVHLVVHRHEQHASLAAVGYALTVERLGVAVSMSGPGATNMVTGIADAWFDSVPTLYYTGQVTTTTYKFDNPARQMGYQETDIVSIVRSITKAAELETDERRIPATLRRLVSKAKSLRPGPVLLDVPFDILRKEIPEAELGTPAPWEPAPPVSGLVVEAVLKAIAASQRPLIIAGGGVSDGRARNLLKRLSRRLRIPVVTSFNGKGVYPNDSPLYFGFIGAYGNRFANIAMANADLIIAIGSRLDSRQTSLPSAFARQAVKIHVDIDRNELNNNLFCDLAVHADIRDFMEKLLEAAPKTPEDRYSDWMAYHSRLAREFDATRDYLGTEENVNPKRFLRELSLANAEPTIYTVDIGNNAMFAAQALLVRENQKFLVSGGLGTMGFAIPAAVGAAFAAPDHRIIAIMGDGGFQMASQELQTIVHYRLPVKLLVLNNGVLGLMKVFQDENYKGAYPGTVEGYSVPDLGKVAAAYGLRHLRAETTEEAVRLIPAFLAEEGPVLFEAVVHRDWTGYPKSRRGLPVEYQNPPIPDETLERFMIVPPYHKREKP